MYLNLLLSIKMGIICSIYIISEDEFRKMPKNSSAKIEDFLDGNPPFTKKDCIARYDIDKAWNPTFELLNQIFCVSEDVFKNPNNEVYDTNIFFHNTSVVSGINKKFDTLDNLTLNDFLQNKEIQRNIKSKQGYRMEMINYPTLIEEHFQILKVAYKEAFNKGHGIILTFG